MTPFILQKCDKFIKSIYALHITAKKQQNHVDDPQNAGISVPLIFTNFILKLTHPLAGNKL